MAKRRTEAVNLNRAHNTKYVALNTTSRKNVVVKELPEAKGERDGVFVYHTPQGARWIEGYRVGDTPEEAVRLALALSARRRQELKKLLRSEEALHAILKSGPKIVVKRDRA